MQLKHIADALNLTLHGDPDISISSLAPIATANSEQLTFVVGPKFLDQLSATHASAVIVPESLAGHAPCSYLVSENPYLSYASASQLLYPDSTWETGIATGAYVANEAVVAPSASIAENAVVETGAIIGAGTRIGPGCSVGKNAIIGEHCFLHANVTVSHHCELGNSVRIQSGAVIGSDGFGFARGSNGWTRIQQVGRVLIGNDVEIGANTTIDRGALEDTVIGDGVILDNQIQIAHNVRIGKYTAIAACVGIAGSTVIGENCTIGGKTAIVGHLSIADRVHLTATSFVTKSIAESGSYSSGMPLQPTRQWQRTYARLSRLDDLFRSLKNRTR